MEKAGVESESARTKEDFPPKAGLPAFRSVTRPITHPFRRLVRRLVRRRPGEGWRTADSTQRREAAEAQSLRIPCVLASLRWILQAVCGLPSRGQDQDGLSALLCSDFCLLPAPKAHSVGHVLISQFLLSVGWPFLRVLSLFAANQWKFLSMNNLHTKLTPSGQAQSRLIKANQDIFLKHLALRSTAPSPHHDTTIVTRKEAIHLCLGMLRAGRPENPQARTPALRNRNWLRHGSCRKSAGVLTGRDQSA